MTKMNVNKPLLLPLALPLAVVSVVEFTQVLRVAVYLCIAAKV